eukprot:368277-Prymnesium_polylepis.1
MSSRSAPTAPLGISARQQQRKVALNRAASRACAEGVTRCREGSALRGMLGSSGGVIREAVRHA